MPLCVSLGSPCEKPSCHTHHAPHFSHTTTAQPSWCWGHTKFSAPAVRHMVMMAEICSHMYGAVTGSITFHPPRPKGLSWQGPWCPTVCHSSTSVSEAQHRAARQGLGLPRCCWAGISRMMTHHGRAVPLHHQAPSHPWLEPSCHGDPEGSPLSGNNSFSHCPQMFGFLPVISAHPSLPPSLLPARPPPDWDQRSQQRCRGSLSVFPALPLSRMPSRGTTEPGRPRHQTGPVQERWQPGEPPGDSAMPGLRPQPLRDR